MRVGNIIPNVLQKKSLGIGDTSKYLGVNVSTLRYWEQEFSQYLKTDRTNGGQRRYSEENIKVLQEIKYLVDVEKYTIDGAKRRMNLNRQSGRNFNEILTEALKDIEQGTPKKEVVANVVMRHQLNI